MSEITIIGAGITGLSCAYFLEKPYRILEKNRRPGGLCGSVTIDGFTFDYSGHFLHLHTPFARRLVKKLLKKNLREIERAAFIYTSGTCIPYPFQANLYPLPQSIRQECVNGFLHKPEIADPKSFYQWSLTTFGEGITRHFMKPYNEKLWTVSARRLAADWVAPFVPQPSKKEILDSSRRPQTRSFGYNVRFLYPARHGSQALIDAMAGETNPASLGTSAGRIDWKKKALVTSEGERIHYSSLVSTQPLPELLKRMHGLPSSIRAAGEALDWNEVTCLNIAIKRKQNGSSLKGKHWIYYPEKKYPFYRAGIYSNIAPSMARKGFDTLYVEISRRPGKKQDTAALLSDVLPGLKDCGILDSLHDVELVNRLDIPYAYVIFDRRRPAAVRTIQDFLTASGIHSIGRYGAWEYSFMEKSILDGKCLAERLNHE